jgi:hypothetical protein
MAEVLLFHHALGQTAGFGAFADELRRAGHIVHAPDLYDGRIYATLEQGMAYAEQVGFDEIIERGVNVAEIVELDHPHPGVAARLLKAPGHLRAVDWVAGMRVGEDEILVGVVEGALRPAIEFGGQAGGHRHRAPGREVGLALRRVLPADEGVAHPDPLRGPVDVPPAKTKQLRLPESGERRPQDQYPQDKAKDVGRRRRGRPRAPAASRRWRLLHDLVGNRAQNRL